MILSEELILLSESQEKFIESGWGERVLNDVEVKKIVYESDEYEIEGYLAYPKVKEAKIKESKIKEERYPLIIWNRGGNNNDGRIDEFLARGIFGEIASWGYVVLASQYRQNDEFGGNDVNDVLNLLPIADKFSFCDTDRIGMEGWSRGGMMAYRVLTMTDRIKSSVIISGLADLFRSEENRSGLAKVYINLFGSEDKEEFNRRKKKRSAVYFAEKINKKTEILLIHGTADDKVSHEDSKDMYDLLKKNGIHCELKLIEGGDHYLKKDRKEISRLRKEWFDKTLKNYN